MIEQEKKEAPEKQGYFDTDEPCATCGKPMNDLRAMAECVKKWVPPGFEKMLNQSRKWR